MRTVHRNLMLTFGTGAGVMLAAAFLPTAVAFADEYDLVPNITTFEPSQVEGYPPLINEVTGFERWNLFDLTTNSLSQTDVLGGTDTQTTIGSFTNDDYLIKIGQLIMGSPNNFEVPAGTQIDLANFGFGFENEWMDIPSGPGAGISDLLITPFGDFELFGTGFSELSAAFTL
jgi:hypothetical protein